MVDELPLKDLSARAANNNNNNNAANEDPSINPTASNKDGKNIKRERLVSLQGKSTRSTRITESVMGSINDAVSKQASSKIVWKMGEIEVQKELKKEEIETQKELKNKEIL
jgi:hypothetical protein